MRFLPPGGRLIFDPGDPRAIVPGYAVRDDGAVLYSFPRRRRWIVLRRKVGPGGHQKVRVKIGEKVRELGVARLVCRAFHGPCPLGYEPLHYPDPSPENCRADNLRWAPVGSSKLGRTLGPTLPVPKRGEAHPNARLNAEMVREIRASYRAGFRYQEIAADLGVSPETVRNVLIGRTWSHVADPLGPIVMRRGPESDAASLTRLDWDAVAAIRAGRSAGRTYDELARQHGVSKCTIRDIIKGRTWRA
jgi:hypothetical protein